MELNEKSLEELVEAEANLKISLALNQREFEITSKKAETIKESITEISSELNKVQSLIKKSINWDDIVQQENAVVNLNRKQLNSPPNRHRNADLCQLQTFIQ